MLAFVSAMHILEGIKPRNTGFMEIRIGGHGISCLPQ